MMQSKNQEIGQYGDEPAKNLARKLLEELTDDQFTEILDCYEIPEKYISRSASQAKQIGELIKLAVQKEGEQLTVLLGIIREVHLKFKNAHPRVISKDIPILLYDLLNREEQILELGNAIKAHYNTQRPLLCLIHSNENESSDRFLRRLQKEELQKLFPQYTQHDIIKPYFFICGDKFSSVKQLHRNISASLGKQLCGNPWAYDKDIVQKIEEQLQRVVMLYTNLCSDNWQNETNILHGFIEFWKDWLLPTKNHLLLVCLSFNYRTEHENINSFKRLFGKKPINQRIRKVFKNLKFNDFGVNGVVLPEFESISRSTVEDWVRLYVSKYRDEIEILAQLKEKNFIPDKKGIAMELLVRQLKQRLNETKN